MEKSAEEGRVVFQAPSSVAAATATVGLSLAEFIVKHLTVERVEELRSQIISVRKKYRYHLISSYRGLTVFLSPQDYLITAFHHA